MYHFKEMRDQLIKQAQTKKAVVAVAAAGDLPVLQTVKMMNDYGFGTAILVGDAAKIEYFAKETGCNLEENTVVDIKDDSQAANVAVGLARNDAADIVMKGLLQTKTYLKAILNKEHGLRTGKLLNAVTAFESAALGRMFLATDCGMIVSPTLEDKIEMIGNATTLANALGCEMPKISCLSAVETVNANMPDGYDAAVLSKMNERGQIKGCVIDGPLSMDLSVSEMSVEHKGIVSPVAGKADVLLMPNLQAGNIFWKTMTYLAGAKSGAVVMGTAKPAVLTSRADTAEAKLNSVAMALLLAAHQKR
ncbi:bifunctional enoyl-CoA hydratase/phosphate acetyltransferase [Eubacterium sp. 1001713B170207_170306_E7]|uniref:bifunctional enoyl-CoA hydratase/phosphate acetyltransferase n=1 Tax=Eubacterium sp. 1001713B170207_170306_E7 TaxID=2787097 RepID=UPI00189B2595|nr:bifunctional enoyl-CoA hydratase/phosphate acetyltransferase [Eubacterium sp. 1001713B170207_170306_E7]